MRTPQGHQATVALDQVAAATAAELAYQVGALLAVLGVHRGARSLLVLADGARWIRGWVRGPGT